ncbi:MAG: MmgE/PrpD family protein [Desulfofustis sp.]
MSELRELAAYLQGICLEDIPENVVSAAKYCVLDSIGAAVGAAGYEEIPDIVRQVQSFSGDDAGNFASIWGHNRKSSVFQAILVNGIMGHALELDDVHTRSKTHIGAVVLPAAWTLAESTGAAGKELLEAVIAGYEVMVRIGKGFGVASHRQKGWHVTGTAGTFGAAASCAKLMKLNEEQTTSALGMAGTQSSGLWAFLEDGASCKKLHPARAAVNGFVAALMAKSGMTGPEHILDAKDGGLYQATSDSFDITEICRDLGTRYELLEMDKKPYPCCRSTHCAIDAILHLRSKHDVSAEDVESILVSTYDIGVKQCGTPNYPHTSTEAKFSTPYVVASALVKGKVELKQFSEKRINDDKLMKIAARIKVEEAEKFTNRYPDHWGCSIEVKLFNGHVFDHEVKDASGSVCNPLTNAQSETKFRELSAAQLGKEKSKTLMNVILNIDREKRVPSL